MKERVFLKYTWIFLSNHLATSALVSGASKGVSRHRWGPWNLEAGLTREKGSTRERRARAAWSWPTKNLFLARRCPNCKSRAESAVRETHPVSICPAGSLGLVGPPEKPGSQPLLAHTIHHTHLESICSGPDPRLSTLYTLSHLILKTIPGAGSHYPLNNKDTEAESSEVTCPWCRTGKEPSPKSNPAQP